MIKCFFDLSAAAAAKVLGVCLTVLKNMRRWMGIVRWPFDAVNRGTFLMTREAIAQLRLGMIARLEAGGEDMIRYQRVLPMLREAVALGLGYKAITAPTAYAVGMVSGICPAQVMPRPSCVALEASTAYAFGAACRVGEPPVKNVSPKPHPVGSALAARVVTGVFKMPVVKRRVNWVSHGAVCLSDLDAESEVISQSQPSEPVKKSVSDSVVGMPPPAETSENPKPVGQATSRPDFCPYDYARDCSTPAWVEPAYPPSSDITDGIAAFWPVMNDPRCIWMQELICRSLVPHQRGPSIKLDELARPAPVSAAEMHFANGFFEEPHDE
jgi:hypothetical protein